MAKRRVVLTGACGYIVQRMLPELQAQWDVVLLDVRETLRDGSRLEGVRVCDLLEKDRSAYRHHFEGADAVIHSGFASAAWSDATDWQDNAEQRFRLEYANVEMAYNVYMAAHEAGVRRVVVASSNHAADWYERLIWDDRMDCVTPDMAPYTDNWYGWAKVAYEQMGFVFATGKVGGRPLEVVQWRIGGPRDDDLDHIAPGDIKRMHRALGAYLSRRDQVQQAVRMVETEDIRDENGVPFLIVYGVSGNTHNFWSIANARQKIGYAPEDNSQVRFADKIASIARAASGEEGT